MYISQIIKFGLHIFRMISSTLFMYFLSVIQIAYFNNETDNLKVKYYEDLINREVTKSENYQLRVDNRDLLSAAENSEELQDFGTFDFIVVGGGSAGSVVATRLSEIEGWKVLLLEAGDLNDEISDIPYFDGVLSKSDRNWGYLTVPQKNGCYGRENGQCPYIRGKILGGSGSINKIIFSRGVQADFDKWSDQGNTRGFDGPLNVAYAKPKIFTQKAIVKANEEIGLHYVEDYNAEKIIGVSYLQQNIQNGRRASGANNFVRPASARMNLNVTLKAFVTKVLIEEKTKTAYGVEFVHENYKFQATARKEVILSGGAANSPQILMLSGVGPKPDLDKLGIKIFQDSPVGQYVKDHFGFPFLYCSSNYSESVKTTKQLIEEYLDGQGAFTASGFYKVISYYNVKNDSSPNPNIELLFVPPQPVATTYPEFNNLRKEVVDFTGNISQTNHFSIHLYFLHPQSSGTLSLKSSSPRDFPLIDSNIFDDPDDLEEMYKGIQVALKLIDTSVGNAFDLKLIPPPFCSNEEELSKAYWICILRYLGHPAYHLSSTAKMGPANDPLAVVNDELKVYGINNLRVIDASIVPTTVTGHMNAVAFLIGEMGADFIKKDHMHETN